METFDAITFEVLINYAWVDISADVLAEPNAVCTRGTGSEILDNIADPGSLTFSLNNSEGNSAGLLGYYSPTHANCRSGWEPGLPVRLSFTYQGMRRFKWAGRIDPDGIKVIPGEKGPRRVDVRCSDYFGQVAEHKINLLAPQTNLNVPQAVQALIGNLPIKPDQTSYYDTSSDTPIPYLFDNGTSDTTALSEFNKLSLLWDFFRYIFVRGDGTNGETLDVTGSTSAAVRLPIAAAAAGNLLLETGDALLLETGDKLLLDELSTTSENNALTYTGADMGEETDIGYGMKIINHVTSVTYPRRIDTAATTILWTLEQATLLAAGESITIRAPYRDPSGANTRVNGTAMVTPVSGTDYAAFANANGTGTNLTSSMGVSVTFGGAEAEIIVTNNHASLSFYFGGESITFQLRGKGIYLYDQVRRSFRDEASINTYGTRALNVEMKYQSGPQVDGGFVQTLLTAFSTPRHSVESLDLLANRNYKNMMGFLLLEPRTGAFISEDVTALDVPRAPGDLPYFREHWQCQGYEFQILPAGIVKFKPTFRAY